jgi:energy-coupling factor transporter ATP-binding protein EcfA2
MEFFEAPKYSFGEADDRRTARENLRPTGISFLDDALIGIGPGDMVLLGAPSGIGKTQLCCNIARANIDQGRKVHFMALEADEYEIERRIKFQIIAREYFAMPFQDRPRIDGRLEFDRWRMGDFLLPLGQLEINAMKEFDEKYRNLFLLYKGDKFGISELIESVIGNADKSDLFIIDHAHYFDFDDDNENRAMKSLAKTVRQLAIDQGRPIILVAHLRKRDRSNPDLVPGIDEFHGSSDLSKIATRVITLAQGGITHNGNYETYFRIPKNRLNGGSKFVIARMVYNPQRGNYEKEYRLGSASLTRESGFQDIPSDDVPQWARNVASAKMGGANNSIPPRHWGDKDE